MASITHLVRRLLRLVTGSIPPPGYGFRIEKSEGLMLPAREPPSKARSSVTVFEEKDD